MSKIKDGNYIVIQGWMLNELQLKGNELLIYAVIYGFSQDGESCFTGSRQYLADWCNITLPSVDAALKKLLEKGLIEKSTETINGITINSYKKTLQGIKNLYTPHKESLHNNIEYNVINVINNKEEGKIETENENIYEYFRQKIDKENIQQKRLGERMAILRNALKDDKYELLSPDQEYELRNYILNI